MNKIVNLGGRYTDFSDGHGNVRITIALLYGLIGTAIVLGVAYLTRYFWPYCYELYYERGPIPYLISFLFGFSIAILILKYLWLKNQIKTYEKNYVKAFTDQEGLPSISDIPEDEGEKSILANRLRKALSRHEKIRSVAAVDEILRSTSDVDGEIVGSSYALINFFTWVIPILGFLGTVIGIGSAIGGFGSVIDAAGSGGFGAVRDNINIVTDNLALAFDTTLLALIYAAIIMFISTLQKKRDEDFLSGVDQFCHDNVMTKLKGVGTTPPGVVPGSPVETREVLEILIKINKKIEQGLAEELNKSLKDISQLLVTNKDAVGLGQKIEQLVNTNLEMVTRMPDAINNLREEMSKMSKLFASIYNKEY